MLLTKNGCAALAAVIVVYSCDNIYMYIVAEGTFPHGDSKTFTHSSRSYISQLQTHLQITVAMWQPSFARSGGNTSHRVMTTLHSVTTNYSTFPLRVWL